MPHFTEAKKASEETSHRDANIATINDTGNYDMAVIDSYNDEQISYIAMQIRREKAAAEASAAHTPRPWAFGKTNNTKSYAYYIAHTGADEHGMQEEAHIGSVGTEANARLIAAAPELLERLKNAEQMLSRIADGETYPAMEYIGAVRAMSATIAKATGK